MSDKVFCLSCENPSYVFVYGSNEASKHGASGAKHAVRFHGAKYGVPYFCGNSYGINTKDKKIKTLPLSRIKKYVDIFIEFAKIHKEKKFFLTRIGCGLAGYKDKDIAPLFADAPDNCVLHSNWIEIIEAEKIKK
ncbi:MAG TPA: hypothetical protein PLP33_14750 [Leptospiraceae bacterium]|nr:hypothetical protein [Leptospiraceae bacterium]